MIDDCLMKYFETRANKSFCNTLKIQVIVLISLVCELCGGWTTRHWLPLSDAAGGVVSACLVTVGFCASAQDTAFSFTYPLIKELKSVTATQIHDFSFTI